MDSASLPYHLSQLEELCRNHPAEEKVVFVPSLQIGHNLGTALARSGITWINLRLTTPAAWAERLVESVLRAEGKRPLVQDADAFFVMGSLRSETMHEDHRFAGGFSTSGFARSLLTTIRALRQANIRPEDVRGAGANDILGPQYAAYCRWIEEHQLYDRAELFRRAALEVPSSQTIFAILDETTLPECAYELVRVCGGDEILRIGRESWGIPMPEHSAGVRFEGAPLLSGDGSVGRGGHLQLEGLSENDGEDVSLRTAIGAENEIRGVLRELLARGAVLDEIEIAYTSEAPYLSFLVEETDRLNLPATFASGVPVTYTRPGQALLGFLRWITSGFDPHELVRLFRSRLLYWAADVDSHDVAAVGGMLLEARLGPGRQAWRNAMRRYIDALEARMDSVDSEGGQRYLRYRRDSAMRVIQLLQKFHGLCPDEETSVQAVSQASLAFLDQFAAWEGDRDKRARESLSDRLLDLAESAPVEGRLSEIASMLAELFQMHKVEAAVARPGSIYVVPLERAGYSGRAETVIIGMAETTFPGPSLEDPILLDAARMRFNGKLKLQRTRAGDPAFHLVRAMGMARGHVTLIANARDISDGREIYPSALFEQAKEQMGIGHPHVYSHIPDANEALTDSEVVLSLADAAETSAKLDRDFPWLVHGRNAVEERASVGLGAYDGWLATHTPDLRPGAKGVLSASRLEDLATCAYRYFLKNVLYVRPPDIPEDMAGRWLTMMEFGSLLHDVLNTFMVRLSERGEAVDADRHAPLMEEVMDAAIEGYRERIPVRFDADFRADRHRLQRAVRVFLAEESRRGARPVGFEVSFGMGRTGTLDVPDPVEVRLDDDVAFSLRGSIDRVDRTDDGYEIWDYKTGSTYDFEEGDLMSGGRRLQWALYAYVLEELLHRNGEGGSVRKSGYFFTSDREHGLRLSETPPERKELGRRLRPLFAMIGKGAFLKVQKSKACTYCDYAEICAEERKEKKHMEDIIGSALPEHDFVTDLGEWMNDEK